MDLGALSSRIREKVVTANLIALEIGRLLIEAKEILAGVGQPGEFDGWLKALGFSREAALKRMAGCKTLKELDG